MDGIQFFQLLHNIPIVMRNEIEALEKRICDDFSTVTVTLASKSGPKNFSILASFFSSYYPKLSSLSQNCNLKKESCADDVNKRHRVDQ